MFYQDVAREATTPARRYGIMIIEGGTLEKTKEVLGLREEKRTPYHVVYHQEGRFK
jgi:hypothetical protein